MKTCPACGQALPDPRGKRICVGCDQPIRRHDRWEFTPRGPQHKDCKNPEGIEHPAVMQALELLEVHP